MTTLEREVFLHPKLLALGRLTNDKIQTFLDEYTYEILAQIPPLEICASMLEMYNETAEEYFESHNKNIFDGLIGFMDMLPPYSRVLDLGCGYGRDAFFMSIEDEEFRQGLMGRVENGKSTLEKFSVPKKIFRVVGVDISMAMLNLAIAQKKEFIEKEFLFNEQPYPMFKCQDMHFMSLDETFDAIIAFTSLFTHTPKELLDVGMSNVAKHLGPGGIFFVSYFNRLATGEYDSLRLFSTRYVKYISQPAPQQIQVLAKKYDLELFKEEVNCRFINQFFRKI